jgi:hypothetical protein
VLHLSKRNATNIYIYIEREDENHFLCVIVWHDWWTTSIPCTMYHIFHTRWWTYLQTERLKIVGNGLVVFFFTCRRREDALWTDCSVRHACGDQPLQRTWSDESIHHGRRRRRKISRKENEWGETVAVTV